MELGHIITAGRAVGITIQGNAHAIEELITVHR